MITYMLVLFAAKVLDNALGTAKTILVQRNKPIIAGVALTLSDIIYFSITKNIVKSDGILAIIIVSIASGVGCALAVSVNDRLSKDRMYVNAIMSDDKDAIKSLYDYFIQHGITTVVSDSYTRDWKRTLVLTAYATTKAESKLIDQHIVQSGIKAKRVVTNE